MSMTTEFIKLNIKNNPTSNAVLIEHRDVINDLASKGFRYQGFVPIKQGPSGKTLEIELVFQKE